MTAARDWLARHVAAAPPSLAKRLMAAVEDSVEGGSGALAEAALERMRAAAALPDRDRETAYQLLAADALLTYACQAAAEEGPGALRALTDRYASLIEAGSPAPQS